MLRVAVLSLALTGCVKFPNSYAPDRVRNPDVGPSVKGLLAFVDMKDGASVRHFGGGISLAAFDGVRRKAGPKAVLRFNVPAQTGYRFAMDFDSAQPQGIHVRVNGMQLGEQSVATGGPLHLEFAVPARLIVPDTATLVEIESEAGIGLIRLGFVR